MRFTKDMRIQRMSLSFGQASIKNALKLSVLNDVIINTFKLTGYVVRVQMMQIENRLPNDL